MMRACCSIWGALAAAPNTSWPSHELGIATVAATLSYSSSLTETLTQRKIKKILHDRNKIPINIVWEMDKTLRGLISSFCFELNWDAKIKKFLWQGLLSECGQAKLIPLVMGNKNWSWDKISEKQISSTTNQLASVPTKVKDKNGEKLAEEYY